MQHTVHHAILADRSRCGQQPIPRQTYWSSAFVIQHILASRADIACESNSVVAWWWTFVEEAGGRRIRALADLKLATVPRSPAPPRHDFLSCLLNDISGRPSGPKAPLL